MVQPGDPRGNTHRGCVHHWLCGDQQHKVVHAVCTKCGMETDFMQCEYPEKFALKSRTMPLTLYSEVDILY